MFSPIATSLGAALAATSVGAASVVPSDAGDR